MSGDPEPTDWDGQRAGQHQPVPGLALVVADNARRTVPEAALQAFEDLACLDQVGIARVVPHGLLSACLVAELLVDHAHERRALLRALQVLAEAIDVARRAQLAGRPPCAGVIATLSKLQSG